MINLHEDFGGEPDDIELPERASPDHPKVGFEKIDSFLEKYPEAITFLFHDDNTFTMGTAATWASRYYEDRRDKIVFLTSGDELQGAHDELGANKSKDLKTIYVVATREMASELKELMSAYLKGKS